MEARYIIIDEPRKVGILDCIYEKPSYYAGYYIRNIKGNMRMKGSIAAEINHSSIASQIGSIGSFPITEKIVKLMER